MTLRNSLFLLVAVFINACGGSEKAEEPSKFQTAMEQVRKELPELSKKIYDSKVGLEAAFGPTDESRKLDDVLKTDIALLQNLKIQEVDEKEAISETRKALVDAFYDVESVEAVAFAAVKRLQPLDMKLAADVGEIGHDLTDAKKILEYLRNWHPDWKN